MTEQQQPIEEAPTPGPPPWYKRPEWVAIVISLFLGTSGLVLSLAELWSGRSVESASVTLTGFDLNHEESAVQIDLTFVNDGTEPVAILDGHFFHPIAFKQGLGEVWSTRVVQTRLRPFTLPPGDIATRRIVQPLSKNELAEHAVAYEPADSTITLGVRVVTLRTDGVPRRADVSVARIRPDLRGFEGSDDPRWGRDGAGFALRMDLIDDSTPYSPHEFKTPIKRVPE